MLVLEWKHDVSGLSPLKKMEELRNPKTGKRRPIPNGQHWFRNNVYTVIVDLNEEPYEFLGKRMLHLSIKRNDRKPIRSWADLQWLKNALCGEEAEAVELFPAESRMMDAANQYHLWVLPPGTQFPFGVDQGRTVVAYEGEGKIGARQEKRQGMGEPTLTEEEALKMAEEQGLI